MNESTDPTLTSAVGIISINSTNRLLSGRVQKAMAQAVLTCAENGVTTEEKNSPLLRECMEAARQAVKAKFPREESGTEAVLSVLERHNRLK